MTFWFVLIILILFNISFADTLLQAQILYRHGNRYQTNKNWNYEKYINVSGYLTPAGIRQEYVLGTWFKSRYIDDINFKLLDANLDQNQIVIRSTDLNRTIQSAYSSLYGLYPTGTGPLLPENVDESMFLPPIVGITKPNLSYYSTPYLFQPTPVHVVPSTEDYVLLSYRVEACPNNLDFQKRNLQSQSYLKLEQQSLSLFQRYGQEMNYTQEQIDEITLEKLMGDQDTYVTDRWNGGDLPPGVSQYTYNQMDKLYPLQMNLAFYQTWDQVKLLSTPFFTELINNIDTKSYKVHMYMAHDVTIQLMLNRLNLTSSECQLQVFNNQTVTNKNCIYTFPGFASNLIFELWQNADEQKYIKVMYNGTYYQPCSSIDSDNCELQEFKKLLKSQFVDYKKGCGISTPIRIINQTPKWVWVFLVFIITILILSILFGLYAYKKLNQVKSSRKQKQLLDEQV